LNPTVDEQGRNQVPGNRTHHDLTDCEVSTAVTFGAPFLFC